MTGRELMMFILENGLENENIFSGDILSELCMTADAAAIKFNTGVSTINTWIKMGKIPTLTIEGITYVYRHAEDPRPAIQKDGKKKKLQRIGMGKKTYIAVKPKAQKEMIHENEDIK